MSPSCTAPHAWLCVQMRKVQVDHRDGGNRDARAEVAFSTPPYKATGVAESGGNQLSISNWLDQRLRNPPSAATRAAAAAAAAATRRCGRTRPPVGTIHARSTLPPSLACSCSALSAATSVRRPPSSPSLRFSAAQNARREACLAAAAHS